MKGEQLCTLIVCLLGNMLLCALRNADTPAMAGLYMRITAAAQNAINGVTVILIIHIQPNAFSLFIQATRTF